DLALRILGSRACRYAAWKIWNIGRIVAVSLFNDHGVSQQRMHRSHLTSFRPACLNMLLSVPLVRSSLSLPGTVTRREPDGYGEPWSSRLSQRTTSAG